MSSETNFTDKRGGTSTPSSTAPTVMNTNGVGGGAAAAYEALMPAAAPDTGVVVGHNAPYNDVGLAAASMANLVDQFAALGVNPPMMPGVAQLQLHAGYQSTPSYPAQGQFHGHPGGFVDAHGNVYYSPYGPLAAMPQAFHSYQIPAANQWARQGLFAQCKSINDTMLDPRDQYPQEMKLRTSNFGNAYEMPALDNRRSSYSTTESTPATPFFGGQGSRDPGARITVFDRSTYTTPSPQQLTSGALLTHPKAVSGTMPGLISSELAALLARDPAVPPAVPAVFTPKENMKTLEQSLVNHIPGNRNVYIRGLHPTTDDEVLLKYAERFGHVETSKAIIDTATSACKGFGFAKFKNAGESEACIRGFFALGYEVGFARVHDPFRFIFNDLSEVDLKLLAYEPLNNVIENDLALSPFPSPDQTSGASVLDHPFGGSAIDGPKACKQCGCPCELHSRRFTDFDPFDKESFNSRLKAEGDDGSTNLYISNLPKSITENELSAIFVGYTILSSKILRDGLGNSRGVGFARFENRDVCDEIIGEFTGQPLGQEGLLMQIRYADTPAQKELKRITAERRQFRTNEYNVGAYGTPLVGMSPTIYSQPGWKRGISSGSTLFGGRVLTVGQQSKDGKLGQGNLSLSKGTSGGQSSDEDGSGDEGVTIHIDSPLVAHGTTRSSPDKSEQD